MHLDVVFLSRLQFAFTLMFHYLFPPLTIGLGIMMVIVEGLWFRSRNHFYKSMALFWTRLFAINFAVGVATGIVMEFQFGTNWATYSRFVGDVFGSALAAEAIFAFFLESGFLAVLVFGWDLVSPRVHFFATCMVALGSIFSSVWITIANSWQQTPAGYHIVKSATGFYRAEITDFWAMVFNPSSVNRIIHVWLGAAILGAFFALSIASFYYLKNKHLPFARSTIKIALWYAAISSCLMLVSGHEQARGVAFNQPMKLAAFEGNFKTEKGGTGMYLFGIPNEKAKKVDLGLSVPFALSFLVYTDPLKPVAGLDQFPIEDQPPVIIPFVSYHIMITLGMLFIASSLVGLFLLYRDRLFEERWLLWIYVVEVLGAYLANESGWVGAEQGRQPWVVYGLLRTKDAVSRTVTSHQVLASIIMFTIVYTFLFVVWVRVMNSKIQHGPDDPEDVKAEAPTPEDTKDLFASIAAAVKRGPSSLDELWRNPEKNKAAQEDRLAQNETRK